MTSQQILQSDLLDILFENRNKDYGAYQLRKTYHLQLLKAMATAITAAFLLLLFFKPSFSKTAADKIKDEVIVRDFKLPEPEQKNPEPPKPPEAPKNQIRQQNFTDHIEITQKEIIDPLPPIDALKDVAISNKTVAGDVVGTLQPAVLPDTKGAALSAQTKEPEPRKEVAPDRQPQFPGGMQAWLAFLSQHLRAPEELESGEKRTVIIRFHVAEDGSIANFSVVQSAGSAFDEEVIRVLKKMPKWTPALQAGRPVPVSFTQPVTFVAVE